LELLRKISKADYFSDFILVGGTALALQIGHRNSVDLDFFAKKNIEVDLITAELEKFGNVNKLTSTKNIFICTVDGIKVDFVNHRYRFLENFISEEGIRMATILDIAAMKLNAIEGRGTKKDFIDLFFLLDYLSLSDMIASYLGKFPDHTDFMMLKSLTYFDDAENFPQPVMFKDFDWENCKSKITQEFLKL